MNYFPEDIMKRFAAILFLLVLSGILLTTQAQNKKEIDKTFSLNKNGVVEIDTYKGSINITTWDKAEVKIHVEIEPDGWGRDEKDKVEATEIIFRNSATSVSMKTDYDEHSSFWGNSGNNPLVHYTITMPKTAELEVDDYKSDTDITGINADIFFETYKGSVIIKDLVGSIDLETYKGEVEVEFIEIKKDSKFESYKGRIDVILPSDAKFSVDADMGKKGDFDSDFDLNSNRRRRSYDDEYVRGDVNGGGPYIEFSTYKGDLRLLKR